MPVTITVNVTSASEPDEKGIQSVSFDLIYSGKTMLSSTATAPIDTIKDEIIATATRYKDYYTSAKKLKMGDTFNVVI